MEWQTFFFNIHPIFTKHQHYGHRQKRHDWTKQLNFFPFRFGITWTKTENISLRSEKQQNSASLKRKHGSSHSVVRAQSQKAECWMSKKKKKREKGKQKCKGQLFIKKYNTLLLTKCVPFILPYGLRDVDG